MRKIAKFLGAALVAGSLFLTSCKTTLTRSTREEMSMPPLKVKRSDYKLVDDVSAEVEVKVTKFLFLTFIKGADKKNIKQGEIVGGGAATSIDEQLALYNIIEKYPDFDYVTNVRYVKTYSKKMFTTTYKTKVTVKGVILNTDK